MEPSQNSSHIANTVYVSNVSPSANEKTVSEFFSFCGRITDLKLNTYPNKGGEAIVTFETEAAAKTALLLTNALIADRPITVVPFTETDEKNFNHACSTSETVRTELHGDQVPNKTHAASAEERTKLSVIASLLAAGYTLGTDAFSKAREIDEQNQLSAKAAAAVEVVKAKANEIDQKLKISENVAAGYTAVGNKVREIDEQYKVSDNIAAAYKTAATNIEAGVQKAKETPAVQTATRTVNSYLTPATETLKEIKQQTDQLIEEKRRAKEQPPPAPPAPNTDQPPTSNVVEF
jgi:RNA recognition motif-containing protein